MKKTSTLFIIFICFSAYAQKTQLRLNLQKDSIYYINCNIKLGIDQFVYGSHHTAKTTIEATIANKVAIISDSLYTIEVSYKNMSVSFDTGDHEIEFSSEKDTSNLISKYLRLILNKPFNMVISKSGKIIEIKGIDNILSDRLFELNVSEQLKQKVLTQMRQAFGAKTLKDNLQAAFIIYPKQPIGIKDTWTTQTYFATAIGSAQIKNTYTLKSVSGDSYDITAQATILSDKKTSDFMHNETIYMRNLNLQGTFDYIIKINKVTGWLSEVRTIKHITGRAELKHNLTDTQSLVVPFTIEGTTDVKGW